MQSMEPRRHLASLEEHRAPLFVAAWEATRGNLTVADLANLTSPPISATTINKWIRGHSAPNYDALDNIAKALGRREMYDWLREGRLYLEALRRTVCELDRRTMVQQARDDTLARARTQGTVAAIVACYEELSVEDRKELRRLLQALDRMTAADKKRRAQKP